MLGRGEVRVSVGEQTRNSFFVFVLSAAGGEDCGRFLRFGLICRNWDLICRNWDLSGRSCDLIGRS